MVSRAPAEQRELAVPGSARGYVGGESHDRYRIAVSKGDRLEIRLTWRRSSGNRAEASVSKSPDLGSAESLQGGQWSRDGRTWRGTIDEEGVIYLFVVAHPSASYTVRIRRVDATERTAE
jgi:hypothetical protein